MLAREHPPEQPLGDLEAAKVEAIDRRGAEHGDAEAAVQDTCRPAQLLEVVERLRDGLDAARARAESGEAGLHARAERVQAARARHGHALQQRRLQRGRGRGGGVQHAQRVERVRKGARGGASGAAGAGAQPPGAARGKGKGGGQRLRKQTKEGGIAGAGANNPLFVASSRSLGVAAGATAAADASI